MRLLRAFLRTFFTHFYTTLAWSYDIVAWVVSVGKWNDWVLSAAPAATLDPVLEVGHGPGHLLRALAQAGRPIFGVDASRQMTRIAHRRLRRAEQPLRLAQARAEALPFPQGAFGSVVSTFPTEYILSHGTAADLWRVLRPGGRLVILPMAQIVGGKLLERLAGWLFRITGQSQDYAARWEQPYQEAGFELQREELDVRNSRVIRIVGER